MVNGKRTESSGSQLCLACGLCCQGILYSFAPLQPDEIDLALNLGMSVDKKGAKDVFHLPSSCYSRRRCVAYEGKRPKVCREYRCKLLRQFLNAKISLQEALQRVKQVQSLITGIYQKRAGLIDPALALRTQFKRIFDRQEDVEFRRTHGALLLDIASFGLLVRRHFEKRNPKKDK